MLKNEGYLNPTKGTREGGSAISKVRTYSSVLLVAGLYLHYTINILTIYLMSGHLQTVTN